MEARSRKTVVYAALVLAVVAISMAPVGQVAWADPPPSTVVCADKATLDLALSHAVGASQIFERRWHTSEEDKIALQAQIVALQRVNETPVVMTETPWWVVPAIIGAAVVSGGIVFILTK